jgi:hypothetical protein
MAFKNPDDRYPGITKLPACQTRHLSRDPAIIKEDRKFATRYPHSHTPGDQIAMNGFMRDEGGIRRDDADPWSAHARLAPGHAGRIFPEHRGKTSGKTIRSVHSTAAGGLKKAVVGGMPGLPGRCCL